MQTRSNLCCKCHFDLSLGTAFKILILAFDDFRNLLTSDEVGPFPALCNFFPVLTKYWRRAVQMYLNTGYLNTSTYSPKLTIPSLNWANTYLCWSSLQNSRISGAESETRYTNAERHHLRETRVETRLVSIALQSALRISDPKLFLILYWERMVTKLRYLINPCTFELLFHFEKSKTFELLFHFEKKVKFAETRDYSELMRVLRIWTRDLQIFSLTLSQLSYLGNTLCYAMARLP